MIIYDFQFKFESSIQWEIWEIELLGRLEINFGANRIALSYVISQNSVPGHNDQLMLDEKAISSAPNTGNKYKMDALV